MHDTILFDFDGTLAPSLELWLSAFQFALRHYDCVPGEDAIIRRCFYRPYEDVARDFGLPAHADLEPLVHTGLTQALADVELFPGVRAVLDDCKRANRALGLVTSSPRPQVEDALQRLQLTGFFDAVVTGSDITHYKPHPEPVLLALQMLNAPARRTLFVGDYSADVLAGRAAGTRVALHAPPSHARFYDMDALHGLKPDFAFSHWNELRAHLFQTHDGRADNHNAR